MHVSLKSDMH